MACVLSAMQYDDVLFVSWLSDVLCCIPYIYVCVCVCGSLKQLVFSKPFHREMDAAMTFEAYLCISRKCLFLHKILQDDLETQVIKNVCYTNLLKHKHNQIFIYIIFITPFLVTMEIFQ